MGKKTKSITIKGWVWSLTITAVGTAAFILGVLAGIHIALKPLF